MTSCKAPAVEGLWWTLQGLHGGRITPFRWNRRHCSHLKILIQTSFPLAGISFLFKHDSKETHRISTLRSVWAYLSLLLQRCHIRAACGSSLRSQQAQNLVCGLHTLMSLSVATRKYTQHMEMHIHILGLNIHYQCARIIPDMHWEKAFSFSVWVDYNVITPLFWRAVDNTGTPEGQEDLENCKYRMFIPAQTVNDVFPQRARYALFCVSWFVANTVQGHGWAEQTVERCITFVSLAVVLAQH